MPIPKLTIAPADGTWVVRAGGAVIGESTSAMELSENGGDSVIYFPREDIGMAFLEDSPSFATSRTLGRARFFNVVTKSTVIADVAWSYDTPSEGAERIAGLIAFDSARVAVEEV